MKNKFLNIAYATDDNYAMHMCMSMISVVKNYSGNEKIRFWIIYDELREEKKIKIINSLKKYDTDIKFIKIKNDYFDNVYISGHIHKSAYFRLLLPDIVDVDKIIYLDCDLLVKKNIYELWNIDMNDKPLAAVLDLGILTSKRLMKEKYCEVGIDNERYFNSGVLVLNLKIWREYKLSQKVLDLINCHSYRHHDQDALNSIFKNNWKELPLEWNVIPPVYNMLLKIVFSKWRVEAIKARENPAIIHYAGRYKPWNFKEYDCFNKYYYECFYESDFKDAILPVDNDKKGKSIIRQLLRLKIASIYKYIL